MLQALVEIAYIPPFGRGQHSLTFEGVVFEGAFVDVSLIFKDSMFFGTVLKLAFKIVLIPLLLTFTMQSIIFEIPLEENCVSHIDSLPISSAIFYLALVVVPIGVYEAAVAVGNAGDESAFVETA